MAIGIYNKLKKAMKQIGSKVHSFAKRALTAMPQIVDTGRKIIGAVSPVLTSTIPGSGLILNGLNRGLDYIDKFSNTFGKHNTSNNRIGKSLINEID